MQYFLKNRRNAKLYVPSVPISSFVIKIFRPIYDKFATRQQNAAMGSLLQKCQVYRLTPYCAESPLPDGSPRRGKT